MHWSIVNVLKDAQSLFCFSYCVVVLGAGEGGFAVNHLEGKFENVPLSGCGHGS